MLSTRFFNLCFMALGFMDYILAICMTIDSCNVYSRLCGGSNYCFKEKVSFERKLSGSFLSWELLVLRKISKIHQCFSLVNWGKTSILFLLNFSNHEMKIPLGLSEM